MISLFTQCNGCVTNTPNTTNATINYTMNDEFIYGDIVLPLTTSSRDERLQEYAVEYRKYSQQLEFVKDRLEYLKNQMLAELPEDVGEWEIPFEDSGRVKVVAPEKYDWDKDKLAEIFGDDPLPECVSQNFTVSKRLYDAADVSVKDKLREALTIKRGTITVKVLKT